MANNLHRFRRLKWADPKRKLTMLPETGNRSVGMAWFDRVLIAIVLGSVAVIAMATMT